MQITDPKSFISSLVAGHHGVVGVDVAAAAVHRQRSGPDLGAAVGVALEGGAAPLARFAREARAGTDAVHMAGMHLLHSFCNVVPTIHFIAHTGTGYGARADQFY